MRHFRVLSDSGLGYDKASRRRFLGGRRKLASRSAAGFPLPAERKGFDLTPLLLREGFLVRMRRGMPLGLIGFALVAAVWAAGMGQPSAVLAQTVPPIVAPEPEGGAPGAGTGTQPSAATGPEVERIAVEGAQRIERETVLSYIGIRPGDRVDAGRVNEALKTLFGTGLFADVTMQMTGNTLTIRVVENPIINRIAFEGNQRIEDETLEAETQLRPRLVYTRTRVQNDVERILEVYRRNGRFAARVEPKVIQLEQNRVDLVFEIAEGPQTGIEKVSFIGNEYFSDSALRGELVTKESRWYRFFSSADTYDPDKLTFDRELLRRFYLANGFADFRVVSAVAELTEDQENFFITFTLEEGPRYTFGEFDVTSRIPDIDPEPLRDAVDLETGDWYDADAVDDTIVALTNAVGDLGYAFVDVRPVVDRDRENREINITFDIQEAPRVYVERIDISGNTRTLDEVIRREFLLVEGDAFNATKLRRSRQRITDLGYFGDVNVTNVPGSDPDKTVVQVAVEEQSTGELSIGAGFSSTDGALGEIAIRERNLLGRGQDLRLATSLSQRRQTLDFAFTEPYFLDRELSAGFDAFHVLRDQQDVASYDSAETGLGVRLGFDYNDDWRQSVRYRFALETIENIDSAANRFIREEEGDEYVSVIGQTLTFDRRNSRIDPTDGYVFDVTTDLAGLGGTVQFGRVTASAAWYIPFTEDIRLITGAEAGTIVGLGDDVRISDRFFLGGDNLRGFEFAGAGPRDSASTDALGGERMANGTVELVFPLGLPEEFGLSGALFSDVGYLTEVDDTGSTIQDEPSIRAAVGTGISWSSPFGPIRVDFSHAVLKEDFDNEEFFRFNFGTRF
jgi:outer membrane protein insertion porin family